MNTTEPRHKRKFPLGRDVKLRRCRFLRIPVLILLFPLSAPFYLMNIWALWHRGAIYQPTDDDTVKKMVELANIKTGEKAVDLGSGDGRLVIALANAGAEAYGYEINPLFFERSKRRIYESQLTGKAFVYRKSYWSEDLSNFDVITAYGTTDVARRLETKLKREAKIGTRILLNTYGFPTWPPSKKEGKVYLYEQKA